MLLCGIGSRFFRFLRQAQALLVTVCRLALTAARNPTDAPPASAAARRWAESPLLAGALRSAAKADGNKDATHVILQAAVWLGFTGGCLPPDADDGLLAVAARSAAECMSLMQDNKVLADCLDSQRECVRDAQLIAAAAAAAAMGGVESLRGSDGAACCALAAAAARNVRSLHLALRAREASDAAQAATGDGDAGAEEAGRAAHEASLAGEASAVVSRAGLLLRSLQSQAQPPEHSASASRHPGFDSPAAAAAEAHLLLCCSAPASEIEAAARAAALRRTKTAEFLATMSARLGCYWGELRGSALSVMAELSSEELLAVAEAPGGVEALRQAFGGAAAHGLTESPSATQAGRFLSRALGADAGPLVACLPAEMVAVHVRRLLTLPLLSGDGSFHEGETWDGPEGSGDPVTSAAAGFVAALVWQARTLPSADLSAPLKASIGLGTVGQHSRQTTPTDRRPVACANVDWVGGGESPGIHRRRGPVSHARGLGRRLAGGNLGVLGRSGPLCACSEPSRRRVLPGCAAGRLAPRLGRQQGARCGQRIFATPRSQATHRCINLSHANCTRSIARPGCSHPLF